MIFQPTKIPGVVEIHPEPLPDERGFFARTWCRDEFEQHGLNSRLSQCSISLNARRGTLRGMHYQAEPFAEAKLVRCTAGAIFDVALDLRRDSPTFRQWHGAVLTAKKRNALYVPEGCAHGLLTLEDACEVLYQITQFYHPEASGGVRWDDPSFGIQWPEPVEIISERDKKYPDFR